MSAESAGGVNKTDNCELVMETSLVHDKQQHFESMNPENDEDLHSNAEYVFGVSINDNNGIAKELTTSPEIVLRIQNLLHENLSTRATPGQTPQQAIMFDELISKAVNMIKATSQSQDLMETDDDELLAKMFCQQSIIASASFNYLIGLRDRCEFLLSKAVHTTIIHFKTDSLKILLERIKVQTLLFFRGLLSESCSYEEVSTVLFNCLLSEKKDSFVKNLILDCSSAKLVDQAALSEMFNPVLTMLRSSFILNSSTGDSFEEFTERIIQRLKFMLDYKLADNARPIAQLVVSRPDFHPISCISINKGREFLATSFLGPFISVSIVGDQSVDLCFENVTTAFDDTEMEEAQKEQKMTTYRMRLGSIRMQLYSIMHSLVVSASTRQRTLDYIAYLLESNRKLSQLQADFSQLASCTSMLNIFCVMIKLSEKVAIEKVQDDYLCHPKCRINAAEETRINMDSAAHKNYQKYLDLSYSPSFNTECFYLTIEYMRISLHAMLNAYSRLKRYYLSDLRRRVREMEERIKNLGPNANSAQVVRIEATLQRTREMLKNFNLSADCYQCLLQDVNLLDECVIFVNKLLRLLLRPIMPDFGEENFKPCIERFHSFPESYLEVAIEFLDFLVSNTQMARIFLKRLFDFPKQILCLMLNLENIKNPFIASKLVELFFMLCPIVNPETADFYRQVINDPLAVEGLFPSLVKFYAAVELTGSHTEFFDKFNIRRNIQVIFKCMWNNLAHRDRMVQFAGEFSPSFVKFINMVINDTTFLLDESLDKLKTIHEIESILSNETEWNKLNTDEQQQKSNLLRDSKNQVKMWLQLGSETMELFVTLTNDAPQIFRREALGERVAAMLNHNIVQLCGPKCSQLKVNDAKNRFDWDPRKLTQQIVQVYINLGTETFAQQIAQDERSYTPDTFKAILNKFKDKNILTVSHMELFEHLADQAETAYNEKVKFEEEFEDELPDEFKDALVYTLMSDPVVLPSGQVCDRKNILRHLLSDPTNPFTRQPLLEDELKPDEELKTRIKSWIHEMRVNRKKN